MNVWCLTLEKFIEVCKFWKDETEKIEVYFENRIF